VVTGAEPQRALARLSIDLPRNVSTGSPKLRDSSAAVSMSTILRLTWSSVGIAPGEAIECFNPNAAVMNAEALSRKPGYVGAIAFSRSGDPATGDFGDAMLTRKFGDARTT
jgi:hypothetical protein